MSNTEFDKAHFSPALLGFYGSCAAVSAGAGMFFLAWFVLTKPEYGAIPTVMKVVGGAGMLLGIPAAFWCLKKTREGQPET